MSAVASAFFVEATLTRPPRVTLFEMQGDRYSRWLDARWSCPLARLRALPPPSSHRVASEWYSSAMQDRVSRGEQTAHLSLSEQSLLQCIARSRTPNR